MSEKDFNNPKDVPVMEPGKDKNCPLGIKNCNGCKWYLEFITTLPNGFTGPVRNCSKVWTSLLLVELNTMLRQASANLLKK